MKNRRYIWHPATVFFLLAWSVVLLSWISDVYGMETLRPETGEVVRVRSLLGPEGLRWFLRHVVTTFTSFRALGPVLLVVAGGGRRLGEGLVVCWPRVWRVWGWGCIEDWLMPAGRESGPVVVVKQNVGSWAARNAGVCRVRCWREASVWRCCCWLLFRLGLCCGG